jgi:RimJ/RimL family protein N-acetyltransferase
VVEKGGCAVEREVEPVDKTVTLKNEQKVLIRHMRPDDVQASYDFFQGLSPQDRKYLRVDVTKWEVVERRVQAMGGRRVERLVVLDGDEIVGDGALELTGHGWGENIGEIRLIISGHFQRTGLGTVLARELLLLAAQHKVARIVARLMRPQIGAHRILHHLGFHEEFLIPEMVLDQAGNWQDMIIMRCNLEDLWREMETMFEYSDWQRHR